MLTLSWSPPLPSKRNGVITTYFVACTANNVTNSSRTSGTIKVIGIDPFTNYTCSVRAATLVGDGPPATVSGISDEDSEYFMAIKVTVIMCCIVPAGPPRQVMSINKNSTSITVSWSAPATPNGVITEYQLQCSNHKQVFNHTVKGSQTTTTLNGLLPYTNYPCNITAHTSAGGGPAATIDISTAQDG